VANKDIYLNPAAFPARRLWIKHCVHRQLTQPSWRNCNYSFRIGLRQNLFTSADDRRTTLQT